MWFTCTNPVGYCHFLVVSLFLSFYLYIQATGRQENDGGGKSSYNVSFSFSRWLAQLLSSFFFVRNTKQSTQIVFGSGDFFEGEMSMP